MSNVLKWIRDRLSERSTKLYILQLVTVLSLIGVLRPDSPGKVEGAIEAGQEAYEEIADSTQSAINRGKNRIEDLREDVEYGRATGVKLWETLSGLFILITSLFGIGMKDAKAGKEYDHREELLSIALKNQGVDPGTILPDLKPPPEFP